jgi:RecA/RadA recombinase
MKVDKLTKELAEGDSEVRTINDDLASDFAHIYPFDCPPVDIPMGGGISAGRIYEYFGVFSAGKSTWALEGVKAFADYWDKKKDPNYAILWIESESTFDKVRAAYMGVPVNKMIIFETDILEEGHTKIKNYLQRCIKKQMKLFIVWDTIAAVLTQKEKDAYDTVAKKAEKKNTPKAAKDAAKEKGEDDDDGKSKSNPGGLMEKPRLIRNMLKDINLDIADTHSTMIVLNQVTTNLGRYGATLDSAGGHGLKHYASVRGSIGKVEDKETVMPNGERRKAIVSEITYKKNKLTGFTKYGSEIWLDLTDGLNKTETNLRFMKKVKIIPMSSGGWTTTKIPAGYAVNGKFAGQVEIKWQTSHQLDDLMTKHPHLKDWFDYQMYLHFVNDSPLVKIKNISIVWKYEEKFYGEKRTMLTEREKNVARILFGELISEQEKEEAKAAKESKETIAKSMEKVKKPTKLPGKAKEQHA